MIFENPRKGEAWQRVETDDPVRTSIRQRAGWREVAEAEQSEEEQMEAPGPLAGLELPEKATKALVKAGFDSPEKVQAASDEELLAVSGIGEATLAHLREARG